MTRSPLVAAGVAAAVLLVGGLGTWVAGDSEWGSDHCMRRFASPGDVPETAHPDVDVDGWSWWPLGVRCRVDGRVEVTAPW